MVIKHKSHDRVGHTIGYIVRTLMHGRYPDRDVDGQAFGPDSPQAAKAGLEFAGGWKLAFAGFKGDWEARQVIHKSVRYYNAKYICEHCMASRLPQYTYADFRMTANCLRHRFTHAEYRILQGDKQSAWEAVPGWCKERNLEEARCPWQSISCFSFVLFGERTRGRSTTIVELWWRRIVKPILPLACPTFPESQDLLHVYHQGVGCVLIASLVCDTLECKHAGITLKDMDSRLSKEVYTHYKKWCHDRSPHATACSHRFSLTRFGKETWNTCPELGSIFKAAVVKTMLYWRKDYLKQERTVPGGEQRFQTMYQFALFQYLMDSNGPFFDQATTHKVVEAARKGLLGYQRLTSADRKRRDERKTYKVIPKFHALLEPTIYIESSRRNPRLLNLKIQEQLYFCFLFPKRCT